MPKPKTVTLRPNAATVIKYERDPARDCAFQELTLRLNVTRAQLHCVAGLLRGSEAAGTDDDIDHALLALVNACERLDGLQEQLDQFDSQHLSKVRVAS